MVSRLRDGGRISTQTLDRLRAFMSRANLKPPTQNGVHALAPSNLVTMELAKLHPHPPAARVFDAGIGDPAMDRLASRMRHLSAGQGRHQPG